MASSNASWRRRGKAAREPGARRSSPRIAVDGGNAALAGLVIDGKLGYEEPFFRAWRGACAVLWEGHQRHISG
jgi:hypothetical protein